MKLKELGYNKTLEKYRIDLNLVGFETGRVTAEHRERYQVTTEEGEFEGEIIGNLRYTAKSRSDFPAVGDWVAVSPYDDDKVLIHAVYPRRTIIERQAVGKHGEKQIIATNIDFAFILQAADRDFNINRLERYLAISQNSKVQPIIVLNKSDLVSDEQLSQLSAKIKSRIKTVPFIAISNETNTGIEALEELMEKGKTYCLLGSSGVGKSTLLNNLSGKLYMKTGEISASADRGRHITSHRELVVLENGSILIDNPGMREVGITDLTGGMETTFDLIIQVSANCKFKDCSHRTESGCAVINAVENGTIDRDSYENYLKMEKEKAYFESTLEDRRKKDKSFGKMIRNIKKIKNDK